jgi:hypothetical protein
MGSDASHFRLGFNGPHHALSAWAIFSMVCSILEMRIVGEILGNDREIT